MKNSRRLSFKLVFLQKRILLLLSCNKRNLITYYFEIAIGVRYLPWIDNRKSLDRNRTKNREELNSWGMRLHREIFVKVCSTD